MNSDKAEVLSGLRQMDEYEFESFVARLWERQGWNTTVTSGARDYGIDIIAEKESPFNQKHLIQVKRYARGNKIGSPEVQQYSSLRQQKRNVDAVLIVTTSSFTEQAETVANGLNVKLIDSTHLFNIIRDSESEDILRDFEITNEQNDGSN
ncbi:restriction endonuclease [Salinigranum salinum]|uniref:restriction endonuclease n=1 Tax=Salinigranum salinum TaxID=1364937 RepID=UPI001260DF5B|nr:restriction endonuclease [Salinigranum salinum]